MVHIFIERLVKNASITTALRMHTRACAACNWWHPSIYCWKTKLSIRYLLSTIVATRHLCDQHIHAIWVRPRQTIRLNRYVPFCLSLCRPCVWDCATKSIIIVQHACECAVGFNNNKNNAMQTLSMHLQTVSSALMRLNGKCRAHKFRFVL